MTKYERGLGMLGLARRASAVYRYLMQLEGKQLVPLA